MKQLIIAGLTLILGFNAMAVYVPKLTQSNKWRKASPYSEQGVDILSAITEKIHLGSVAKPDPNYFQKFRIELNKLAMEEHELAKSRGILVNSMIKLPVETLSFFIATGAINFMSMWNHAGGNPLVFQEQVLNLKDPIANFSFYAFMAANGFYTNFRSDRLSSKMSPETKAIALRRISYQAMAAGSIASSVVADVGQMIKQCSAGLLGSRALHSEEEKAQQIKADQACSGAMEIWTVRNISQKYLPQIFSLLIVQASTQLLESGVNGLTSVSIKSLYNLLLKAGEKAGFQMLFVNVALSANPSRFAIRSIALIGKVTQFGFFVGVDHMINNTVTRGFNNIFKQLTFKYLDHAELNRLFEVAGKYQWDDAKISTLRPLYHPTTMPDKKTAEGFYSFENFKTTFPDEISNFSKQLQGWRDHLNSETDADLASWLTMTNRLINQIQVSENFYSTFLKELFVTSNTSYRVSLPKSDSNNLPPEAFNNVTSFPFRPLPLYGVKFIPWQGAAVKEENAYLAYPLETQTMQSALLVAVAKELIAQKSISSYKMSPWSSEHAENILNDLASGIPTQQGKALSEFMQIYNQSFDRKNYEFRRFGSELLQRIGKPNPKLNEGEGFSTAFFLENKSQFETADFDTKDVFLKVSLENPAEYLYHAMLCGPESGYVKEYAVLKDKFTVWEPDFLAPRLVKQTAKEFCAENKGDTNSQTFFTTTLTNPATKQQYKNVIHYLTQNLKSGLLGDYTDKQKFADFPKWWSAQVMVNIPPMLQKWDAGYAEIVNRTVENMFNSKTAVAGAVDKLTQFNMDNNNILAGSVIDSYRFEKEFYLQTINLIHTKAKFNLPAKGNTSILYEAKKIALGQFSNVLSKLTTPEYKEVSDTLESMIAELAKPVDFLKYEDQIKKDEELQKIDQNFSTQLNYKNYLKLQNRFEKAISALEANVGLKNVKTGSKLFSDLPDGLNETASTGPVYEDAKVENPSFEQKVVASATAGLRSIEDHLSKYVRMKILMRRGLSFTKDELKKFQQQELEKACSKSTRGCS